MKAEDFLKGVPVPVEAGSIERRLRELWRAAGSAGEDGLPPATRACLSTVAVLTDIDRAEATGEVLRALSLRHPGRMLLLALDPLCGEEPEVTVSAVCHRPPRGRIPVCAEEIRVRLARGDPSRAAAFVRALRAAEVPLHVLAGGDSGAFLEELEDEEPHAVFDGRGRPAAHLEACLRAVEGGIRADDALWFELDPIREAVALVFDDPGARRSLASLERVQIRTAALRREDARLSYAPVRWGYTSFPAGALLVLGWITERLRLEPASCVEKEGRRTLVRCEGRGGEGYPRAVECVLEGVEAPDAPPGAVLGLRFDGRGLAVGIEKVPGAPLLAIRGGTDAACFLPRSIPVPRAAEIERLEAAVEAPRSASRAFASALRAAGALAAVAFAPSSGAGPETAG